MEYFIFVENGILNGAGQCRQLTEGVINFEVSEEVYNKFIEDTDLYIWDGEKVIENPNYEEVKRREERERLDMLTLTPADVERALYRSKGLDFEDLKELIHEKLPTLDIKGLAIEFRAKDFFRGAEANGMRLFDVVGQLLGYTPEDMDLLFLTKNLPAKEQNNAE